MHPPDAALHRPDRDYILRLLRATGMSRSEVAARLGVHRNTLVNWIATGRIPYADQYALEALAEAESEAVETIA